MLPMMCVACADFWDKRDGCSRRAGDAFECSPERLAEINGTEFGRLAWAVAEEAEPAPAKTQRGKAKG